MSPRAAARLETLGFTKVYDYEAGKSDWLAAALPSEGSLADMPAAGDVIRGGDIVCHLGERLGDAVARLRAAGKDACIVVDRTTTLFLDECGGRLSKAIRMLG